MKHCSERCKHNKPSTAPASLDRRIEEAFAALLQGQEPHPPTSTTTTEAPGANREQLAQQPQAMSLQEASKTTTKKRQPLKKGDHRILVPCSEVESAIFDRVKDPTKVYGRKRNRAKRGTEDDEEWKAVGMNSSKSDDEDEADGDESESAQHTDGSIDVGTDPKADAQGSTVTASEELQRRKEGQKLAKERELVKCAARRACVFGLLVPAEQHQSMQSKVLDGKAKHKERKKGVRRKDADSEDEGLGNGDEQDQSTNRRKCEAVMNGKVVEPSFAKGDWCIRWREEQ